MIVFVAGVPRTGSMWTYNVARMLLEAGGNKVLPVDIPASERALIDEAVSSHRQRREIYCIKTHFLLEVNDPAVKFIHNYRDVRDAMFSFMNFMRITDFETGFAVLEPWMSVMDAYFAKGKRNILHIRYEEVTGKPEDTIQAIAAFLELTIEAKAIREICLALNRESVEALIRNLRFDDQGRPLESDHVVAVKNFDGSTRLLDRRTGFQSNHIAPGAGSWRTTFTPQQINRLNAFTQDWLRRYGFEV